MAPETLYDAHKSSSVASLRDTQMEGLLHPHATMSTMASLNTRKRNLGECLDASRLPVLQSAPSLRRLWLRRLELLELIVFVSFVLFFYLVLNIRFDLV